MHAIDEIYTARPFYGSRGMKWDLRDDYDITICRDHVRRLMRVMGLQAIYPRKIRPTSDPDATHTIYPYLLRGVKATHPNHIWGTDITFIRLEHGFAYLMAIMDWYSRYVLSWELSETLEANFCIAALERALTIATPEIHNSDQGSQFTSATYVSLLQNNGIQVSMDGRGRCMDNIFTERLWRTVKYEHVYLHSYQDINEARGCLADYFSFYNTKRRHQSLNNQTPASLYYGAEIQKLKVETKKRPPAVLSKLSTFTV